VEAAVVGDGWSGVGNAVSTRTAAQNRHRLSRADKFSVTDVAVAAYPVGRYVLRFVGNAIDQHILLRHRSQKYITQRQQQLITII